MAHSDPFNLATPDGTDDPREGDDRIRELKRAIQERVTLGGIFWDTGGTPDDNAGKIAAGIIATNKWYVYETDKTTVAIDLDDSASSLTLGDGIGGSNPYTMIADVGNFGDLNITGDIIAAALDRPVISGGTSGREHHYQDEFGLLSSGAGPHVLITTSASIESSTHASPPTRSFFCMCSAAYGVVAGGPELCDGAYFERQIDGGGWSTTGFIAGQTGAFSVAAIATTVQRYEHKTFMDVLNLATTAEQIEFRFVLDDLDGNGGGMTTRDITIVCWEMFSAIAT